jgi:hypothetical protein
MESMDTKKNIAIITDNAKDTLKMAEAVSDALKNHNVKQIYAGDFAGTDILRPGIIFLGCASPNPASFSYLAKVLKHINLAGRKGGIFAASKEAAAYLEDLVRDSDITLPCPSAFTTGMDADQTKKWAKEISEK